MNVFLLNFCQKYQQLSYFNNYFFHYIGLSFMFKVRLELIGFHKTLDLQEKPTLKLKKQHWHYNLIEKIQSPILSFKHQFLLKEESQKESQFQLQLMIPTTAKKAKIIGSALINIKEWPLQKAKRDKVTLSPQVWIDLSIAYEYIIPQSLSSSISELQLGEIQYQQENAQKKQLNTYLKSSLFQLQQQLQTLTIQSSQLEQKKQRIQISMHILEKNHLQAKELVEAQKQKIENQIFQAKLVATNLINVVNNSGSMDLVQELNEFLQAEIQKTSLIQ